MHLINLLEGIHIIELIGENNLVVSGIAYDSRTVNDGYVFVCIQGMKTDGHNFIKSAIKSGAKVLVIDKEVAGINEMDVTVIRVHDSRIALSRLSSNFYHDPSKNMKVIGVTGTNGKTSITYLINSILEANNIKCGLIGTINNKINESVIKTDRTTPEALELHKLFSIMVKNNVEICTMEVSSHALEMRRVDDVKFNIGIFTNLTPDHLDYHDSMDDYKKAKLKLFYKSSEANIINIDDKYGKEIYEEIKNTGIPVISYGLSKDCDLYAEKIQMHNTFSEFTLVTPDFSGRVKFNIPGMFSIYNLLAAVSACYKLGYNFKDIQRGIESIETIRGRFELVKNDNGINIVVDYAHTPDALENVLSTIKQFAKKRIIVVFGCGGDRDRSKRPLMGKCVEKLSDTFIITNDNPRSEDPNQIINDIIIGLDINKSQYKVILDRREAITTAIEIAEPDDFILIAGKGHETYQIIGEETHDFDDREVALRVLKGGI